ncbi:MAG: hypothetical protein KDE14_03605 [Rhodobacteraceae bacterium]|nr:hypothetical protein [Paracoccaceae bacterium]
MQTMRWVLFALVFCAASAVAEAQVISPPLSGSKTYGGAQTISCLQGGAIIFQHVGVTRVRLEYNEAKSEISFRLPSGAKREIDIIGSGLTCLIEDYGQESVPIQNLN